LFKQELRQQRDRIVLSRAVFAKRFRQVPAVVCAVTCKAFRGVNTRGSSREER
jgi:hypothetical protein